MKVNNKERLVYIKYCKLTISKQYLTFIMLRNIIMCKITLQKFTSNKPQNRGIILRYKPQFVLILIISGIIPSLKRDWGVSIVPFKTWNCYRRKSPSVEYLLRPLLYCIHHRDNSIIHISSKVSTRDIPAHSHSYTWFIFNYQDSVCFSPAWTLYT